MEKRLIVNADDLGYSEGINEGIIKAHKEGIVTSTSLMVNGRAAKHGVNLAKKNPRLGLGLHFQVEDNDLNLLWQAQRVISVVLIEKTKKEFLEQVQAFKQLTDKMPDHIDSHHHVHKMPRIFPFIKTWCRKNRIPYRMQINFIDSFFGMPSTKQITVENLLSILGNLYPGVSELMCHPGLVTPDLKSSYSGQRELELKALTFPRVKQEIKRLGIDLSYPSAPSTWLRIIIRSGLTASFAYYLVLRFSSQLTIFVSRYLTIRLIYDTIRLG